MLRTTLKSVGALLVAYTLVGFSGVADACDKCIAQRKAQQQASEGRMRHVGGSLGSGGYEGVGYSSRSAEEAVRNCCYWGQRTPTAVGVARGPNGWYATVLYR